MGFRRYLAPNAREAMEKIRKELGPEAVILSNRRSGAGRVEIIAAAPGEMRALVEEIAPGTASAPATVARTKRVPAKPAVEAALRPVRRAPPESFQEFIRRQATVTEPRIEPAALYAQVAQETQTDPALLQMPGGNPPAPEASLAAPAVFHRRPSRRGVESASAPAASAPALERSAEAPPLAAAAAIAPLPVAVAAPIPVPQPAAATPVVPDIKVMAEINTLRSVLSDRITTLEARIASAAAGANPPAASSRLAAKRQAMTRLLMSGFSPEFARNVAQGVPPALDSKDVEAWLHQVIAQNIHCPEDKDSPIHRAGAIALVGPTGVGKTTTMAKLAARFVVRYGAAALGLINLDSYRMGAQEQLRGYGRILGVPVQMAHDGASLRDMLASMQGKRQVLIDTCGLSQRDPRLADMLAMIEQARFADRPVDRVLLINAASHAETLDEVARAWHVAADHGVILTKIDEAARIGGALDTLTRYKTQLLGLTNGQRVPEDWHAGNPQLLAHIALKPFGAAFSLDGHDLQALSGAGALLA